MDIMGLTADVFLYHTAVTLISGGERTMVRSFVPVNILIRG